MIGLINYFLFVTILFLSAKNNIFLFNLLSIYLLFSRLTKKMWTFLGIASFTYLYKKSDTVLTYAHKELLMAVALFLTVGLLLSYISFHGQKLRLSQVLHSPLSLLSFFPVINYLIPQNSTLGQDKAENGEKAEKMVRGFTWIHVC